MMEPNVLVVSGDVEISYFVDLVLRGQDCKPHLAADGDAARRKLSNGLGHNLSLLVVDANNLPGGTQELGSYPGVHLVGALRHEYEWLADVPVIMLGDGAVERSYPQAALSVQNPHDSLQIEDAVRAFLPTPSKYN